MKPVKQTRVNMIYENPSERGNCFAACIASILEIECEDVFQVQEHFHESDWPEQLNNWLISRGYRWRYATIDEIRSNDTPIIVVGTSPRDCSILHTVIFVDGKMVHDPHPDNSGIVNHKVFEIIEKLKPQTTT